MARAAPNTAKTRAGAAPKGSGLATTIKWLFFILIPILLVISVWGDLVGSSGKASERRYRFEGGEVSDEVPDQVTAALNDLKSEIPQRRMAALVILSRNPSPESLDALRLSLVDPASNVRLQALHLLRNYPGYSLSIENYLSAMGDEDAAVRRFGADGLAALGPGVQVTNRIYPMTLAQDPAAASLAARTIVKRYPYEHDMAVRQIDRLLRSRRTEILIAVLEELEAFDIEDIQEDFSSELESLAEHRERAVSDLARRFTRRFR